MTKQETAFDDLYRDDLAHIHVDGYGFHWEGAASAIVRWMREHGIVKGLLVDLGCGGGQWLARADQEGCETVGIDVSLSMIRQAERNSPNSRFVCASFADANIPECDVVTSLGEPLNYLNSGQLIRRTIKNVFEALRKDGLFVFDVRHPPSGPVDTINHVKSDDDWFCHARIEEDANHLVRHITTFRRNGKHFRRDQEVHRLKLFPKSQMLQWLRRTGFRVRAFRGYGEYQLGERQSVFLCRKP